MSHSSQGISDTRRKRTNGLFVTGLMVLGVLLLRHGFYLERYKVFLESLFSGSLVGEPLSDFLNLAFIWLSLGFSRLYTTWPDVPWFDWSAMGLAMLNAVLFVRGLSMLAVKRGLGLWPSALLVLAGAVLISFNFVSCNSSRDAYLLPALMLMVLWGWDARKPLWGYGVALLLFMLGVLVRFEFAALAAVGFGMFVLVQWRWLAQQSRWLALPCAFLLVMAGYLYIDRNYSDDFAKATDFSQYLVSDADFVEMYESFSDPKDSLRYIAATELWLSDTSELKVDFFRSLQQYKIGFSVRYFQEYFPVYMRLGWQMLSDVAATNWPFVALPLILWLYLLLSSIGTGSMSRGYRWAITMPLLGAWLLLFIISYLVRMETTVLQPVMMMAVVHLLAISQPWDESNRKPGTADGTLLAVSLAAVLMGGAVNIERFANTRSDMLNANKSVCLEADSLSRGGYLMLDQYSNLILDHRPGHNFTFTGPEHLLLYDCGQLILSEPYLSYHREVCDCNPLDNVEFYHFILRERDKVLILSNDQRMAFVFGYLRGMHGMAISYQEVDGEFAAHELRRFGMGLKYYRVTTDGAEVTPNPDSSNP